MKRKPSADDVKIRLQEIRASVPRAECWLIPFPSDSMQTNGRFLAERWKEVRADRNC
jgi:hypothetical protein